MTEVEKRDMGKLYLPGTEVLSQQRERAKDLCFALNHLLPSQWEERERLFRALLGPSGENIWIEPNFFCDYGYNITAGNNFYVNHNCVILDGAPVTFGDDVMIGPNCGFYTAGHPLDQVRRDAGLEFAKPIVVKSHVWIGGHTSVLPGVTIGEGAVIGTGSVVTRDIPPGVVAVGNPCRVLRAISETSLM